MVSEDTVNLPSFSIVIETHTLSQDDYGDFSACLASLADQTYSPEHANEVIVVDGGRISNDKLQRVCNPYPWVTIHSVERSYDIFQSKMAVLPHTSGAVVILADADCAYQRSWLESMLSAFAADTNVQVVTGETTRRITGFYTLALALTGTLPRFSYAEDLDISHTYWANNCAFRRDLLVRHPIPEVPHTYRASGGKHAYDLRQLGHTIWKQPGARAYHPTIRPTSFARRFMLQGHDSASLDKLGSNPIGSNGSWLRRGGTFYGRIRTTFSEDARYVLYVPLALPIVVMATFFYLLGYVATRVNSEMIPKMYLP